MSFDYIAVGETFGDLAPRARRALSKKGHSGPNSDDTRDDKIWPVLDDSFGQPRDRTAESG